MGALFSVAQRLSKLPPYLFAEIDRLKQDAIRRGMDIINLGVGDPDLPTPSHIVARMQEAAADSRHHQYPSYEGMLSFRQAVADWYSKRFGVTLDPQTEGSATSRSRLSIRVTSSWFPIPAIRFIRQEPSLPTGSRTLCRSRGNGRSCRILKRSHRRF
jgi:LL-diaminopimelate aminotransferase